LYTNTGSDESDLVITRSALGVMVVVIVVLLLPAFGSVVGLVTTVVFVSIPVVAEATVTRIVVVIL
jgi:hypothetical protein